MAELSLTVPGTSSGGVAGSGISLQEHELIDSLVHNLSEDTYQEILRDGAGRVSAVNIYTSPGGILVRSTAVARNSNGQVNQTVDKQYDGSGALIQQLTTDVTRSGGQVVSLATDEVII